MNLPPCPPCPQCGEAIKIAYTVSSERGSYCRCAACGQVWHVDLPPVTTRDYSDRHRKPE